MRHSHYRQIGAILLAASVLTGCARSTPQQEALTEETSGISALPQALASQYYCAVLSCQTASSDDIYWISGAEDADPMVVNRGRVYLTEEDGILTIERLRGLEGMLTTRRESYTMVENTKTGEPQYLRYEVKGNAGTVKGYLDTDTLENVWCVIYDERNGGHDYEINYENLLTGDKTMWGEPVVYGNGSEAASFGNMLESRGIYVASTGRGETLHRADDALVGFLSDRAGTPNQAFVADSNFRTGCVKQTAVLSCADGSEVTLEPGTFVKLPTDGNFYGSVGLYSYRNVEVTVDGQTYIGELAYADVFIALPDFI